MATAYDVPANELINKTSEKLKEEVEEVKEPDWAEFVKTSPSNERPPTQQNWWYIRSAALLRKVYTKEPIGVERLRKLYGGRERKGSSPEKATKGSGKIIRNALQQLEEAGFVEKTPQGRKISSEGKGLLDSLATEIKNNLEEKREELKKY